jgi:predicted PolB exonuclease-like 3'-5' exonuclease
MGLPGKLGMDGAGVWDAYQAGKVAEIRNYCETDVVNTYLIFLRFQLMRGVLTEQQYKAESEVVRTTLKKATDPHWKEFLGKWRA